jgi:hypothetical protein
MTKTAKGPVINNGVGGGRGGGGAVDDKVPNIEHFLEPPQSQDL